MRKLKKNDNVIVLSGKDKGKIGTILKVINSNRLLIQGINIVKKKQKPNPATGTPGGIINLEASIHISNVAIYNFSIKKQDKVGIKLSKDNIKNRIYKTTGELIDS